MQIKHNLKLLAEICEKTDRKHEINQQLINLVERFSSVSNCPINKKTQCQNRWQTITPSLGLLYNEFFIIYLNYYYCNVSPKSHNTSPRMDTPIWHQKRQPTTKRKRRFKRTAHFLQKKVTKGAAINRLYPCYRSQKVKN